MSCEQKLPNGRKSKLYPELVNYYDGNEIKALNKFAEIFTKEFKHSFGDWQNKKFKDTYWGGEPTLETVLGIKYSKQGEKQLTQEQINTATKITSSSDQVSGPHEKGFRYLINKIGLDGVTTWLSEKGADFFDVLALNFNLESVKKDKIESGYKKYAEDNINATKEELADKKKDIEKRIEKEFSEFPLIADAGTEIHLLMESIFNGVEYKDLDPKDFPKIKDLEGAYSKASGIVNNIKGNYPGAVFLTEVQVFNKKAGLAGTIDLIIVKADGTVDIYDWKSSKKESDMFSNSKITSINYQLSIYKQILQAYGLTVNDVRYYPVKMDLDSEKSEITSFDFGNPEYVPNTLEMREHMNSLIPVKQVIENTVIKDNLPVLDFMKEVFNHEESKKDTSVSEEEIDEFIRIKKENNNTHFVNEYSNESNKKVLLEDDNLRQKVASFLKADKDAKNKLATGLYETILSLRTTDGENAETKRWAGKQLKSKYKAIEHFITDYEMVEVEGKLVKKYKWARVENKEADQLGILLMVNNDTGIVEVLLTTSLNLSELNEFEFGKTLSSNIIASANKQKKIGSNAATNANVLKMKAMAFIVNNKDLFSKYKIDRVSILSQINEMPDGVAGEIWYDRFKSIIDETDSPLKSLMSNSLGSDLFNKPSVDQLIDFYTMVLSDSKTAKGQNRDFRLSRREYATRKEFADKFRKTLEDENSAKYELQMALEERFNKLMADGVHLSDSSTVEQYFRKRELSLLSGLIEGVKQNRLYADEDLTLLNLSGDSKILSQPDEIKSPAIRATIELTKDSNTVKRQQYTEIYAKPMREYYKALFKEKQGDVGSVLVGKAKLYRNLFEFRKTKDGEIVNTFVLRDPEEKGGSYVFTDYDQKELTKAERNLLKQAIRIISNERNKKGTSENINMRAIPIMRESAPTKLLKLFQNIKSKSFSDILIESVDSIGNPLTALEEDKTAYKEKKETMLNIFNSFDSSEKSPEAREKVLADLGNDEVEIDLEVILSSFVLSNIKTTQDAILLPKLNAIRATVALSEMRLFKPFPEILDYVEMLIKGEVYGERMKTEEQAKIAKKTESLKAVVSSVSIGLSPTTAFVNVLTGLWQTNSAVMGMGSDRISMKSWLKASSFIMRDAHKTITNVNFIDYINQKFGVIDMETSRMIQTLKEDKQGIKNFEKWLHFMNSYPDYLFRISLFLGEAIEEGVFEVTGSGAISKNSSLQWDDKIQDIVYNPKKDKRFSELFKNNPKVNSIEYKKQKSLYDSIYEDLSKEYGQVDFYKKEILSPYATKDIESKKKFASQVYQETSTENKTVLERLAYGSLLTMFKRWLFAKKNLYYREYMPAEENLIAGKRETYLDKETGEYKTIWVGRPMEGIFQSLYFTYKELQRTKSIAEASKNLDEHQIRNLKHLATDLFQFTAISLITGILSSDDEKDKKRLEQKLLRYLDYSGRDLFILNTWNSLTMQNNTLFAVSYVNTLLGDMMLDLYDGAFKENPSSKTLRNIGLTRSIQDFYSFIDAE